MTESEWKRVRGRRCRCQQKHPDDWLWAFAVPCPNEACGAPQGRPCVLVAGSCFLHDVHNTRWRALVENDFVRAVVLGRVKRVTARRLKPHQELLTRVES